MRAATLNYYLLIVVCIVVLNSHFKNQKRETENKSKTDLSYR